MITNHNTCLLTKAMEPSCMYYVCVFNTYVPYAIRIEHMHIILHTCMLCKYDILIIGLFKMKDFSVLENKAMRLLVCYIVKIGTILKGF